MRSRRWWVLACVFSCVPTGLASAQNPLPPAPPKPSAQPQPQPGGPVARLGQARLRHADKVTCVAFAPDSQTFITGGDDGTVRVWSVATGEQLSLLQNRGHPVSGVRYTHGGKRVAVTFGDNLLRFLDPSTLKEIGSTALINRHHFAFSADGAYLATSDFAGNTLVTETANDLPKLELTNAEVFDFRPDGKAIAVGDAKGAVTVHLLTGGKPIFKVKQAGAIKGLAYSPNGTRLAVGSRDADGTDTICIYEPAKDKPVAEIAGANRPRAWIDSDSLACGTDTEGGVYSLAQKKWLSRVNELGGEFAVSPDGTKLAATGSGLRVRLWDLSSGKQLHAENDSFPEPTLMVGSADGRGLFLLSMARAYLWPVGGEVAKPAGTLPGRAVAAAATRDKLIVATPEAVIVYEGFDPTKPLPARPSRTFKNSAGARAVASSPAGDSVAWAIEGGKVIVTDVADKDERRELPVTTATVFALGFNPAGDRLGVLGRDPFLRVWDVSDEREKPRELWKARIQRGHKGAVVFSPDGKYVTAVSTSQLLVFSAHDPKEAGEIRQPLFRCERYSDNGAIQHAVFSPDSRLLIVGSAGMNGRVEVWELATRGLVRAFVTGYGGISQLCIIPPGARAASAGAEEAVTVWDITFRGDKPPPKAGELLLAVNDLASPDAAVGYPALKAISAAGNRGAEALHRATKDLIANQKEIKEWIEDLGSETFSVRENASKQLVAQGSRALPALLVAVKADDPEVRDRASAVLGKLNAKGLHIPPYGMIPDTLRLYRAVQALEEIGTEDAKSVLKTIAEIGGPAGDEAKAALKRWKK